METQPRTEFIGARMTMPPEEPEQNSQDIPRRVFEQFLSALQEADEDDCTVAALRKVLLEDKVITEKAFLNALIPREKVQG